MDSARTELVLRRAQQRKGVRGAKLCSRLPDLTIQQTRMDLLKFLARGMGGRCGILRPVYALLQRWYIDDIEQLAAECGARKAAGIRCVDTPAVNEGCKRWLAANAGWLQTLA